MEKFSDFAKKYSLADLLLIFVFLSFLFILYYAKQNVYLVDVGREAYIPWRMLEGEVLYRDIFNVYGPLGYQINALLYKLFGIHLNTLYLAGFLNSALISFMTYYVSKLFVERKLALSITAVVISVCVFAGSLFNFIFPYSYSAVYALSSFWLSLFTMLLYIKYKKQSYLFASFLFAGFSFANKIEYLPYFAFMFLCLPFLVENKRDWREYITAAGAFLIFPILSFAALLFQGARTEDFFNAAVLVKKLAKTPSAQYFYNAYGLYFNPLHVLYALKIFLKMVLRFVPCALIFYALNFTASKYLQSNLLKKVFNTGVLICIVIASAVLFKGAYNNNLYLFSWLGLFVLFVLCGFGLYYAVLYFKKTCTKPENTDLMYIYLLISSVLVSLKGISDISLECYGTFSTAVLFVPFVLFFAIYLPKIFKFLNADTVSKTLSNMCMITVLICLVLNGAKLLQSASYAVVTERGSIFVKDAFKTQNDFIRFIKTKTPKDSVITAVPEGAIINFLAERRSNGFYYYLIPVNVQIFGEEKIVSDFKKIPPDYFITNSTPYTPFGLGRFEDYAPAVNDFIMKNYTPIAYTNDSINFVLYKRNAVVK